MILKDIVQYSIYHYSYDKFWKYAEKINHQPQNIFEKIEMLICAYKMRKMEAFNNATMGIKLFGGGACIKEDLFCLMD